MAPRLIVSLVMGGALTVMAALLALSFALRARRRHAMAALAGRLGLAFEDQGALPPDLRLQGTFAARLSSHVNLVQGRICGTAVLVFDATVGQGKVPWRMTIYAVCGGPSRFDAEGLAMQAGAWSLWTRQVSRFGFARLDTVAEVEAVLKRLAGIRSN